MENLESVKRNGIVAGGHSTQKREFADYLRRNMTPAERRLWSELRAGRLGGLHFRRQQIIDGFIVDFFCYAAALIIEIDGGVHSSRVKEDEDRARALQLRNLEILRFTNRRVTDELPNVLAEIEHFCWKRLSNE